ncbi:MAG: shikimate kinase I [Halieaceae bacterium]|nr:shikimate kinase I [Halieaceae bacterium]|tara:strand:+ start:2009 stop:2560 length:552 start_codon:yes stop_codon:yes gene_type:complete
MATGRKGEIVFMVGPMGSGKSTVGRHLSELLGYGFIDSDAEIEARAGADIPWIFDVEGEAGFRRRESAVLADLATQQQVVIATGGGAILAEPNRQVMADTGVVVFLNVSVAQQLKRTGSGEGRPLLQAGDREATLTQLMAEREPLYSASADVTISASGGNARKVARHIETQLRDQGLISSGTE